MPQSLPEIWIVPESDVDLKNFTDEDAAAIRTRDMQAYGIVIIEPRTYENREDPKSCKWLDGCWDYIAPPGHDNVYTDPRHIRHEWLRFYATDMWAHLCGIQAGHLVRHQGRILSVIGFDDVDQEYGVVGYKTGFVMCQPTTGDPITRAWVGDVTPVLELSGGQGA